jgi:hypothetical protein
MSPFRQTQDRRSSIGDVQLTNNLDALMRLRLQAKVY